jgi:hypothetical protein
LSTFTVREFLMALYAGEHKSIAKVDPEILQARMNFTHFATAHENLCQEVLPDLFVDLLRRSAALQLGPFQPTYDMLIPIYFGDESEPLDPSECGCIVVQVKNREVATTPTALFGEDFTKVWGTDAAIEGSDAISESTPPDAKKRKASRSTPSNAKKGKAPKNASTDTKKKEDQVPIRDANDYVFRKMEKPILLLLFDLGFVRAKSSTVPAIEVSHTSKEKDIPRVWAIHSRGHGQDVFGCLDPMGCRPASDSFFTAAVLGSSLQDRIARGNDCFYELDKSFRYPPATEGT